MLGMLIPIVSSALRASRRMIALDRNGIGLRARSRRKKRVWEADNWWSTAPCWNTTATPLGPPLVDALGRVRLALEPHLSAVLLLKSAQDLDQGRRPGPVVAHQPQHLALAEVDVDVAQRGRGT